MALGFSPCRRLNASFSASSGPDFLYADTFYPDCNTYVLVSLEPVESIPELQSVSPAFLQNTLQNIEVSLNTLLNFCYFQTQDLREYSQRTFCVGLPIHWL
jgi:hypothetical protein